MALKSLLTPLIAQAITSPRLLQWRRRRREWARRLTGRGHRATFWFRANDPYSWLMVQVLPELAEHFGLHIEPRVVLYLEEQMYPQPEMLEALAPRDVLELARIQELEFPEDWRIPDEDAAFRASRILLKHEGNESFWNLANWLSRSLWHGDNANVAALAEEHGELPADQARLKLESRRDELLRAGHYLSATVHYEGEWYWSVERLDYLSLRLRDLGLADSLPGRNYARAKALSLTQAPESARGKPLDFFFSFRSPYSCLALSRTFRMADYYGLELNIRPVLPMVMRGLAVPAGKRFYILRDAAREARRLDIPFGRICDPVGPGVENCMALWPFAEKEGKLRAWLQTAATGIWSRGVDVADRKQLGRLCEQAGLDWNRARRWLDDDGWRERAEQNRSDMMAAGSWGVPTFLLDDHVIWGQDRFGVLERLLLTDGKNTGGKES